MHDSWQIVARALLVFGLYAFSFWRMARRYRGDKFIEFGSFTLIAFFLVLALRRVPTLPEWILDSLTLWMYLLCLITLGFMFQQIYRAIRNKMRKRRG